MKAKMFTNQVSEIKNAIESTKEVKTTSDVQTANAAKREKLGAKELTPREIWAKFEKGNALNIAAKVIRKSGFSSYSFDAAKEISKDFTLLFTMSENETTLFETIGAKSIYSKAIEPNSVDSVLRSFESCKLHFDALRIEANRKQRIEANREKTIKQMQSSPEILLAAAAAALGVSVEDLQKMRK